MEIPHTPISASAVAGTATRYSDCLLRALNVKDISNDVLAFDCRSNTAVNTHLLFLLHTENCKSSVYFAICLAGCGKTRFEADAVPQNSLVSTAQPDKKKVCVEKTISSWMCSAM